MIYGCRLGFYLMICEMKSVSYQSTTKNEIKDGSNMKFILKVVVWNSCALLYCCEVSPDAFRLENDAKTNIISIIMTIGILLESADDLTKNYFEKKQPKQFCNVGLFKIVCCPNYLGEVLTWTGVFLSGVTVLQMDCSSWWLDLYCLYYV